MRHQHVLTLDCHHPISRHDNIMSKQSKFDHPLHFVSGDAKVGDQQGDKGNPAFGKARQIIFVETDRSRATDV